LIIGQLGGHFSLQNGNGTRAELRFLASGGTGATQEGHRGTCVDF
jgi:hypothetical protein